MARSRRVAVGIVVLFLAVLVLGWDRVGQLVGPSCGLRLSGTAASVEVRGWSATRTCAALASSTALASDRVDGSVSTCSSTLAGARVSADLRAISKASQDRLCGFLAGHTSGATPLPSLAMVLMVQVASDAGTVLGGSSVRLRDPSRAATSDGAGMTRLVFPGGLGPGTFNVAATHPGYTAEATDFRIAGWQAEAHVTVRLSYLAPSGTFVRRSPANVWDVLQVDESEQGFTGKGTEISYDCASDTWQVLPVFVGRVKGKDALRFKDFEVPIVGSRMLPPEWVPNGVAPDFHGAPPVGTC